MNTSKIELAALMNPPPNSSFHLAAQNRSGIKLSIKYNAEQLTSMAMLKRPEIREALLKERITAQEANAALLELLPGTQVFGGANWNSNDLLFHQNWVSWGARASWNAMSLFSLPGRDRPAPHCAP